MWIQQQAENSPRGGSASLSRYPVGALALALTPAPSVARQQCPPSPGSPPCCIYRINLSRTNKIRAETLISLGMGAILHHIHVVFSREYRIWCSSSW
jgi:hypothetical protein